MPENKLLSIFNALSGVEKRECSNFLRSPYFNQREDVLRLWQFLLDTKGNVFQVEAAYAHTYPGKPYDYTCWRYVQSFLLARIDDFLAQRALDQTPLLHDLHLSAVYREKNLAKALGQRFQRLDLQLEKLPRDHNYYHWQYRIEWEKYATEEQQTRTREYNLGTVDRALDIYLVSSKLRLACLMESHRAVFNITYDTALISLLIHFLATNSLCEVPVVALYYHCYRALTDGLETDFREFRRQLERQSDQLPVDERRTFLLLALNFCIRQLNTGEARYIREAFDLYRVGLDTGALFENGHLSRFAYKNIVALGLRLEEFDWVGGFIPGYASFLEEKFRAANRDYNLARLCFAQKDYREAMPLLARVDESDLFLNIDSRFLLLKMYYETGEWDALDALIASFKILLLRKKKMIGYHYTYYQNTLRYIQKLTRLNRNDKNAVAAFQAEVERSKALNEKEWLLLQSG